MKILTNKQHKELLDEIEIYKELWRKTKEELKQARGLEEILKRLTDKKEYLITMGGGNIWTASYDPLHQSEIQFVPKEGHQMTYVADELCPPEVIIKEKATKVIFMDKDGNVIKSGYTKKVPDTGYSYKLIREK